MELLKRGLHNSAVSSRTPDSISEALKIRRAEGNFRELATLDGLIDFSSNDYLGFSTTGLLKSRIDKRLTENPITKVGSTGSRLLAGNSLELEALENRIAQHHGAEAALVFNSGYCANVGILSSVPKRDDTILYDALCHASIIDGTRLSLAKHSYSFKHNDLDDLRSKLSRSTGNVYIVVESVYSMDGDFAPLIELAAIAEEKGAYLIVDEAHATGIFGPLGAGRVSELGLEGLVFARICTYGKALGCHGASVLGSKDLREYLINFARSFIYTTAIDIHTVIAIDEAYSILSDQNFSPVNLFLLINEFRSGAAKLLPKSAISTFTTIQGIQIPGNDRVKEVSKRLQEKNIAAKAILHPTVPKGSERIRVCLHSFNTIPEVQLLLHTTSELI